MVNKKVAKSTDIAQEYVEKGLIPEDYKDEFAQGIDEALRRKSFGLGADVADVALRALRAAQLSSLAA